MGNCHEAWPENPKDEEGIKKASDNEGLCIVFFLN